MIKEYLKTVLSVKNKRRLKNIVQDLRALGFGFNLTKLGRIYSTDKAGVHFYTPHYQTHFRRFKYHRIKLLEIGVGGYKDLYSGGNSLRMWKKYFPFGKIFSLDIYDKSFLEERRLKIFQGSQIDTQLLTELYDSTGELDIIIDDGSHINKHVIESFIFLFPKLKVGGVYVIEDTQTSYWKDFGGDSKNLNNPKTLMNFFKSLTDAMNNQEFELAGYEQTYYDRYIVSMHFYHNLIFIHKGINDEKSNVLIDNQWVKNQ
jgi:demethylmacrocin O-methyltransferase